jgi:hydrogenase maturation protease
MRPSGARYTIGERVAGIEPEACHRRPLLVAGLGSPHGDDQLGWVVIDRLRPRLPAGVSTSKVLGGLELLECLEGQDEVIVVDASAPAGRPGTIRSFDWPCRDLAEGTLLSTHGLGLITAVQMAEALGWLPHRVCIIAVEARQISPAAPLSGAVAQQIDVVTEVVLEAIGRFGVGGDREGQPSLREP